MSNHLNDLAPYPRSVDEATAETLIRHLAVSAQYRMTVNDTLVDCRTPDERTRYLDNVGLLIGEHSLAKALRALIEHAPAQADEVAKQVWVAWEDGATIAEDVSAWLTGFGIDPDAVNVAAADAMRDAA
jgi:hypothetical protein